MVHRLEDEFWGRVDFIYLDQYDSANREFFTQYGLRGRPIFLVLQPDGTELVRWFGAKSENDMRVILETYAPSLE